jgi:DNA-binding NtrC family response regulator
LEKSNWVKTKAAKLLNINRTTLVEKIKKQNLTEAAAA